MPNKIPNNLEAEIAVLSCAFLSESALDKICEDLSEDMFYSESNKKIYNVIKDLRIKGVAIDSTTVSNELDKRKQLKSVGGIDCLTEIIEAEPTAANVNHYINILFEKTILRSLIEKATTEKAIGTITVKNTVIRLRKHQFWAGILKRLYF